MIFWIRSSRLSITNSLSETLPLEQLWKIPVYGDLAQLYLEANVISTLPIELAQFTKLETLSVSQNR